MQIQSTRVFIAGNFIPATIQIEGKKITNILPYEEGKTDINYGNKRIVPGFIDVHCHGAYGYDTNNAEPEGLKKWCKEIVHEGVTGFLSTTLTQMKPVLLKAVENVKNVKAEDPEGAEILGIHFEGPYLDMKHKGAQPEEAIVEPSVEEFKEYQEASGNLIKIITLAPEHDKDFALTKYCSDTGVIASMGHSDASRDVAMMAIANGARSITHTYNAMTPFTHRENGLVGVALRMHDLYSEIICDCNHSTPDALHIFFTSKSRNRCIMISDALMCKGFEVGSVFDFGGQDVVIYPDGSAHLVKAGNLAGSTLKINEGLKNLVERANVPFDVALNSCTINPAEMLNIDDHKGKLVSGYDADIVVLNDDYSVETTFARGIKQF